MMRPSKCSQASVNLGIEDVNYYRVAFPKCVVDPDLGMIKGTNERFTHRHAQALGGTTCMNHYTGTVLYRYHGTTRSLFLVCHNDDTPRAPRDCTTNPADHRATACVRSQPGKQTR